MARGGVRAAIQEGRTALRRRLAADHEIELEALHDSLARDGFSPDAESAGRRALRNAVLDLLATGGEGALDRAEAHFRGASNMTDAIGGLTALMILGGAAFDTALADFYARWKDEPLVIDKWFSLQSRDPSPGALGRVLGLTVHPAFDTRNPNRFRALVGGFSQANPARFHDPSGGGYRFLADQILAIDRTNPNTAARMIEPLASWRRYKPELADLMKDELERIAAAKGLSKNVLELGTKALDG
jgi:aminopeptidase N